MDVGNRKRFSFSIRTKIIFGFILVTLLLTTVSLVNINQLNATKRYSETLQKRDIPIMLYSLELRREVYFAGQFLTAWLVSGKSRDMAIFQESVGRINRLKERVSYLMAERQQHDGFALWKNLKTHLTELQVMQLELIKNRTVTPVAKEFPDLTKKTEEIEHDLGRITMFAGAAGSGFISLQEQALLERAHGFALGIEILKIDQWAMMFTGIVITLVIAFITARLISDPLQKAIVIAQQVTAGRRDLIIRSDREDEAGVLLNSLSEMQLAVKQAENRLRANEAEVQELLSNLQRRVQQYHDLVQEISSGDLTKRLVIEGNDVLAELGSYLNRMAEGLLDITRDIASAVANMTASVSEVRRAIAVQSTSAREQVQIVAKSMKILQNIRTASDETLAGADDLVRASEQTLTESQKGLSAVEEVKGGMTVIRSDVQAISTSIAALAAKVKKIAEITAAVNSLSERSKLLALNASIEAAKAGEAGRGFSIVAAEVKTLADQSQHATAQVQVILGEIDQAALQAVEVSELGVHAVDRGLVMVEQTGQVISALGTVINEARDTSVKAVKAIQNEALQIDEITAAMSEIRTSTEKVQDASRKAQQIADVFVEISQQLDKNIRRYRVDDQSEQS